MKDRGDSPYAEDWLKIARRDWHRIHVLLNDGDADGAGFFLQQATEKYLKAFLLTYEWKLKKVHTLQSLLDEARYSRRMWLPCAPCARGCRDSILESAIQVLGQKGCKRWTFSVNCPRLGC